MRNGYINLYLDDLRSPPRDKEFCVARNIDEALSFMEKFKIDILSLDHDLGEDDEGNLLPTGYDLVKIICEKGKYQINRIYLHTHNPVGRSNMFQTLRAARKRGFLNKDIKIYPYAFHQSRYTERD